MSRWAYVRRLFALAAGGLLLGIGAATIQGDASIIPELGSVSLDPDSVATRPGDNEWVLVYIGSSSCAWSQSDTMPPTYRTIRRLVSKQARHNGASFSTLGIALDWSPESGIQHLARYDGFDAVATGRNWYNTVAHRFLWGELPGPAATPQFLVIARRREDTPRSDGYAYRVVDREMIARRVGLSEILRWADRGAPVRGTDEPDPVSTSNR